MNVKCSGAFEIAYIAVKNIYQSCEFVEEFNDKLTQSQKEIIGWRIGSIENEAQHLYWYIQKLKKIVAENATTDSENSNG